MHIIELLLIVSICVGSIAFSGLNSFSKEITDKNIKRKMKLLLVCFSVAIVSAFISIGMYYNLDESTVSLPVYNDTVQTVEEEQEKNAQIQTENGQLKEEIKVLKGNAQVQKYDELNLLYGEKISENEKLISQIENIPSPTETKEYISLKEENDKLKASIDSLKEQLDDALERSSTIGEQFQKFKEQYYSSRSSQTSNSYTSNNETSYQAAQEDKKEIFVYVTRTGSKYHTHKCGNGTYYQVTLDQALARGLDPCSKCY